MLTINKNYSNTKFRQINCFKVCFFIKKSKKQVTFSDHPLILKAHKCFIYKQKFQQKNIFYLRPTTFYKQLTAYKYKSIYCPFIKFKIPDFLNLQRLSFQTFLKKGLIQEFEVFKKITNSSQTVEIKFYATKYKLNAPKWTPKQAILQKKTYACQLFIPVQLTNYKTQQVVFQWILLANLPLMTKNGHFIINGSPKIIMNQIVRSPGVYFQKLVKQDQQIIYCADFIAQRGAWLRLEVDNKKGEIWAKLKKTPKIPVFIFLRCLGLTLPILNNYLKLYKHSYNYNSSMLVDLNKLTNTSTNNFTNSLNLQIIEQNKISNTLNQNKVDEISFSFNNIQQNFIELCKKLYPKPEEDVIDFETLGKQFLYTKFLNNRTYSLSPLGRFRINQKLGINIPLNHTVLTAKDILFACFYLIECLHGTQSPTDIDDLKNRKIKSSGELIQIQLATGLMRFEKIVREKLIVNEKLKKNNFLFTNQLNFPVNYTFDNFNNKTNFKNKQTKTNLNNLLNPKPINAALREFFSTNPLTQLLDQTNPLAEITHKRRLSSLGPGGISRDTAGMAIRGIHPTHYGRICPIETPEGQNAGLVNSFTIYSKLNQRGFIETPFYKTYKGFILKNKNPFLFSSDQEKTFNIAPGDIKTTTLNFLPKNVSIPSRKLKEFKKVSRNELNFIALAPIQMISIATSLIPFLEHDDGNRALMGSNMQRQAVPTIKPSKPIVGTGLESRVISDINHGLQAKISGFVSYVDGQKIIIYSPKTNSADSVSFKNKTNNLKLTRKRLKNYLLKKSTHSFSINNNLTKQVKKLNFVFFNNPSLKITKNFYKEKSLPGFKSFESYSQYITTKNQFGYNCFLCKAVDIKKYNNFYLKNFSFLSSKQLYYIFNLFFENSFFGILELIKNYSKQATYCQLTQNYQPLLSNRCLLLIKQFYNKTVLLNYSKIILNYNLFNVNLQKNNLITLNKIPEIYFFNGFALSKNINNKLLPLSNFKAVFQNNRHLKKNFLVYPLIKNIEKNKFFQNSNNFILGHELYKADFLKTFWFNYNINRPTVYFNSSHYFLKNYNRYIKSNNFINKKFNKGYSLKKFQKWPFYNSNNFLNVSAKIITTKNLIKKTILKSTSTNFIFSKQAPAVPGPFSERYYTKSGFSNKLVPIKYELETFHRSNQDTYLVHRPTIQEGEWVEKGDILADNSSSVQGELSIGQNLLVGYTPWEGYNFEDAVLISDRVICEDLFTTLHIERYEIEIRDTAFGREQITNQLPNQNQKITQSLDQNGIVKIGTWVQEGSILVGKVTPLGQKKLDPYEKLLYDIIGKDVPKTRDTSLRVPLNVHGRVIHIEVLETSENKNIANDTLTKEKTNSAKVLKVNSKKSFIKSRNQKFDFEKETKNSNKNFKTKVKTDFLTSLKKKKLDLIQTAYYKSGYISTNLMNLTCKVFEKRSKTFTKKKSTKTPVLFNTSLQKQVLLKNNNLFNSKLLQKKEFLHSKCDTSTKLITPIKVHVYLAEKRKIQVGDKIAGRHGNKGIISNILPRQDMPYIPDGTPLDLVLNPLGVPSRMNVGQIFECLLGLAGYYLGQNYKIQPFDEIYGCEASRSLVYSKLYEASIKTGQNWLFNANFPGKTRLFDGRTGQCFEQPVTVGRAYILKLVHLVDEKIHARSTGPYSLVTQQPLRGRSKQGGQRVGEMEVWALEGFGAAYILQELLTIKSDDIAGRNQVMKSILNNDPMKFGTPESFKVLIRELQSLCLDISIYKMNQNGRPIQIDVLKLP